MRKNRKILRRLVANEKVITNKRCIKKEVINFFKELNDEGMHQVSNEKFDELEGFPSAYEIKKMLFDFVNSIKFMVMMFSGRP